MSTSPQTRRPRFFAFFFFSTALFASSTGPRDLGLARQRPVDGCLSPAMPRWWQPRSRLSGAAERNGWPEAALHVWGGPHPPCGGYSHRRALGGTLSCRLAVSRKIQGASVYTRTQCNEGAVDLSVDRVSLSGSAIRVMQSSPRPRADYCRSSGCYELPCWDGRQWEARVTRWVACTSPIRTRFQTVTRLCDD